MRSSDWSSDVWSSDLHSFSTGSFQLNMNNRQSGRRRGRNNSNNNRSQSGGRGGVDQANRIDSRARGNAVQMIEKYKNMARDAQLAGDRVKTEYYLQFADHYLDRKSTSLNSSH